MSKYQKLTRRRVITAAAALSAGVVAPAILRVRGAYAAYPERPVKIVVANTPGGPSDLVGRVVAAALQQSTGKTFIIENRGGAGGNIGMGYVAHTEADGYTLLLATNAYSVNVGLYKTLPFDPRHDFVAVSELAGAPNIFVVRKELPAKTMKEFVALAKTNADKYNVSVPPIGTTPQLQATLLKARENLPSLKRWCSRAAATLLQRCSAERCNSPPIHSGPHRRTSRRARSGVLPSVRRNGGRISRRSPP